ncbi:MAG: histone [candidate division NC10 bacterium]|nr:histone [candidate division NC10 bacterium]
MMKKLGIVLMAAFFSVSVAGLSFADEMKEHKGMPAATSAPANPCAGKEMKEAPKKAKKKVAKKKAAAPKEEEAPAAAPAAPAKK